MAVTVPPTDDDYRPVDDYGRVAVAGKVKLSKTEVKIGEWAPIVPVLRSDDARSLPQTFEGAMLTSKEVSNMTLYAGHITGNSQRNDASMEKLSFNNAGTVIHGHNTIESDQFNFGGIEHNFNQSNTLLGAWYAQLQDIYNQTYLQLNHSQPLTDNLSLGANMGYFFGNEDGEALAGTQDNKTFSGLFSLKSGAHTFYIGLQKVAGDAGVQRISGTSGTSLANDSFSWSYDGKHEKSWQVRYDYNFAGLGFPGLTMMNRFIKGTNVHFGEITDGEDRGRESELGYVIQGGPLKQLNMRLRSSSLRRNYGNTNSFNETRFIVQYPISFL
ncbi:Porin-like protein NicP [compost metagenome]